MDTLTWRKASRSGANGGDCVELAAAPSGLATRDSKDPDGPQLHLTSEAAHALFAEIKRGSHDLA